MGNRPLSLTLVELGVPTMNGFAAAHAGYVDVECTTARRGPPKHIRPPRTQLEGHRPISSVTQKQCLRRAERHQRAISALITHFRVRAKQGAAASIDAAQTVGYGEVLHGHLTQSNRSARLIRPEM